MLVLHWKFLIDNLYCMVRCNVFAEYLHRHSGTSELRTSGPKFSKILKSKFWLRSDFYPITLHRLVTDLDYIFGIGSESLFVNWYISTTIHTCMVPDSGLPSQWLYPILLPLWRHQTHNPLIALAINSSDVGLLWLPYDRTHTGVRSLHGLKH